MPYKIEIEYTTGGTFVDNHTETEIMKGEWNNLESIEQNLYRIQAHARWEDSRYGVYGQNEPVKQPPCARGRFAEHNIWLLNDDGTEFEASAPWSGYFERFEHAKIIISVPSMVKLYD